MKSVLRASRIGRIILRYRLDDLLQGTPAERWLRLAKPFVPRASADIAAQSRGARLRLALQDLGPIFVKFGQILSTRRDLVPPDVAVELTLLQDRVKPFDGDTARRIVEQALGGNVHRDTHLRQPFQLPAARLLAGRLALEQPVQSGDVQGLAYLRTLRLSNARHDLLTQRWATVTETAMQWNFFHLGRFSQDYQRIYGETPSQTFRRNSA